MSLGAITIIKQEKSSAPYKASFKVVGDGAYPSNGTAGFSALLSEKVGQTVTLLSCKGQNAAGTKTVFWQPETDKLLAFVDNAEESNAADLSAVTYFCEATWK